MKPKSSKTTGTTVVPAAPIGMLDGEHGSGTQAIMQAAEKVPPSLQGMLTPLENILLAKLNWLKKPSDGMTIEQQQEVLTKVKERIDRNTRPPTVEESVKLLTGMAIIFRTELPEPMALDIYVNAMGEHSIFAATQGVAALIRSHKYPNMPLVSEVVSHISTKQHILNLTLERTVRALAILRLYAMNSSALPGATQGESK